QFDLQVRDSGGNFTQSHVIVTVLPEPNAAPTAVAGSDVTVRAEGGTAHVLLNGHGYDADGDELTYLWSTGDTTQDIAVDLDQGIQSFSFTVSDPYGAKATAHVTVRVLDTAGPVVTLNGTTPMSLEVFNKWIDPGATATDDVDGGDLAVHVNGSVNNK